MQVQGQQGSVQITSIWDGFRQLWASGGTRAVFRGLSLNYIKVVPSTAIGFTVYDALKQYLAVGQLG